MFNAMKYFGDYLLGNNGIEHNVFQPTEDAALDDASWSELRRRRRR